MSELGFLGFGDCLDFLSGFSEF